MEKRFVVNLPPDALALCSLTFIEASIFLPRSRTQQFSSNRIWIITGNHVALLNGHILFRMKRVPSNFCYHD